ncbi:unnamed protein product [Sphagnum balticum]
MSNNFDSIFERWKAALQQKDRSRNSVSPNFDELFDQLLSAGASFDEARTYLQPAIKAHLPAANIARAIWKNAKNNPINAETTEKEFIEGWHKYIADSATTSFYNMFPVPADGDDKEKKIYGDGKITEKEYKLLRDHANKFKPLDLNSLPDPNENLMTEQELLDFIEGKSNE